MPEGLPGGDVEASIWLVHNIAKYMEKNLDTTKPRYSENIFAAGSPLIAAFDMSRLTCSVLEIYTGSLWNLHMYIFNVSSRFLNDFNTSFSIGKLRRI